MAAMRRVRELALVGKALASTGHPVMAQIVPARFCNLSCAYCNEYDKVSEPVPIKACTEPLTAADASIVSLPGVTTCCD